jgi:Lrp/AsnC family leucine-responsive transcriptional regulator
MQGHAGDDEGHTRNFIERGDLAQQQDADRSRRRRQQGEQQREACPRQARHGDLVISELARRIGLSAPAARERLARLEEAGVIRGWRVELDPRALGYGMAAYERVNPSPGQLTKAAQLAQNMPQVVECHRVTGEDCFVLKVHIESMDRLDSVLDRFLAFGRTTTSIIQSTPVEPRALPLPRPDHDPPSEFQKSMLVWVSRMSWLPSRQLRMLSIWWRTSTLATQLL